MTRPDTSLRAAHGSVSQPGSRDRGSVTLFLLVAGLALLLAVGLVVDGGGKLLTARQARAAAAEAARAAGQGIAPAGAMQGQQVRPSPSAAAAAGRGYLAAAGVPGTVTVTGDRVEVRTTLTYNPKVLTLIGVGPQTVTARAQARLARGLDREVP
jgi:Flp pilus assembly protein TadG